MKMDDDDGGGDDDDDDDDDEINGQTCMVLRCSIKRIPCLKYFNYYILGLLERKTQYKCNFVTFYLKCSYVQDNYKFIICICTEMLDQFMQTPCSLHNVQV